jgi:hypothetical protein
MISPEFALSPDVLFPVGTVALVDAVLSAIIIALTTWFVCKRYQRQQRSVIEHLIYPYLDYLDVLEQTGHAYREIEFRCWVINTYGLDFMRSHQRLLEATVMRPTTPILLTTHNDDDRP